MQLIFTKQDIIDKKGCYSLEQVNNLSFINKSKISLIDILDSKIPYKDKLYFFFICNKITNSEIENIWDNCKEIQKIITKSGLVFGGSCYYFGFVAQVASIKELIIKDLINYLTKF